MGYLSDALKFEVFHTKDLWDRLKKDPKRLVLGVDPWSTKAWNAVLGRDDEPLVDQLGGAYAGHTFSMGDNKDGGVYERARAAGVPTGAGGDLQDAAHVIASMYGAQGLGGAAGNMFGGGAGGGAQPGLWEQGFAGKTNFATGMPSSSSSAAAGIPGIAGPVGGGTGASSAANMGAMDWAKLGQGLAGSGQQQQPQQPAPQVRNMAQPGQVPTMGQRLSGGLGRVGQALFPVDPNTGMTPDQMKALRTNAMMQMGLGMMAASGRGAGFGESLAKGYGLAQGNLQGAMQQAYENSMANRAETRAVDREKRLDDQAERAQAHQQWLEEHTLNREQVQDERYATEQDYRLKQNEQAQKRWEAEQKAMADWRNAQISGLTKNPEVRVTDRGMFEKDPKTGEWKLVPGTEPTGVSGRPIPQGMANDLKTNATVIGQIDKVLPQLRTEDQKGFNPKAETAFGARNAVIDMMTPDGISDNVKNMVDSEGTDLRATVTNLNSFIVKERNGAAVTVAEFARQRGFLPTDKDNVQTIETKLKNLREALASEQQYMLDFAESQGYRAPPAAVRGSGLGAPPPAIRKSVGGRNYVQINGQWYEDDGTTAGQ